MKLATTAILAGTTFLISLTVSAQDAFISPKLEKVWTSTEGLNVPESSCYNADDKTIYVSNIVGMHNIKDGMGYISKLNEKGEFIEKEWVKGLNAPKGIACTKTSLYVTDIDRVIEVDLKTGKIEKTYQNRKSKSLNDVAIASDGRVYISDSGGNCIFYVAKDSLEVFMESDQLSAMNGILANDNLLYLGSKGNFISVGQKTKAITILSENVGYLDGILMVDQNKFITSDFGGKAQLIEPGKGVELLINTTEMKINAADLGFIPSQKLLLVPTFYDNKVVAYKLKL
jgi:outer membrane protein assembly factor BamB